MSSTFKELSQEMLPAIDDEMRAVLQFEEEDLFYGMIHYHMGWRDAALAPLVSKSGKRIRPLLVLLSCQAAGGEWRQALPAAAAVEILHNFTLVHDDIQDASPTRRGRETAWRIWGEAQAINTGDAMFAYAHLALARLLEQGVPAEVVVQALRRLDECCIHLTQGQHADMEFEQRTVVTVSDYLAMIGGKTAALLALCGELGAMVAGCDAERVAHYSAFGRNLGLAFQMRDDILGIWGDEALIGKSAATDIITRKKSLPVLYGLEKSAALHDYYAQPENHPAFVTDVVRELDAVGAHQHTEKVENEYSQSAINSLAAGRPQGPAATALDELIGLLLGRRS